MQQKTPYFFIGTEAELIKLFPIFIALKNAGNKFCIIASGQNNIQHSSIFTALVDVKIDIVLSNEESIDKNPLGLLLWWLKTYFTAKKKLKAHILNPSSQIMVVHGDTVSTVMGAFLGSMLGMKIAHVEAGLRSHSWLSPFPEEIDRVLTSKKATLHFCPASSAMQNLKNVKGKIVNTEHNTIADALAYSKTVACKDISINALLHKNYFVFVLHRQENLASNELVNELIKRVEEQSKKTHCVIILHKITEITLKKQNLYERLAQNENITLLPRSQYFDFCKLLLSAQFVVTDGGSNQEELALMGKPCLILRERTERADGIGENIALYNGNYAVIDDFFHSYPKYHRPPEAVNFSPSELIAQCLMQDF